MGNRIARRAQLPKHASSGSASGVSAAPDIQQLHQAGREFLNDLQSKLVKTQTDRDTLEQELGSVRSWLDRVEVGNAELLEALKDARNKTSVLTSELDVKKQRILALESELESLQVHLTGSQGSPLPRNEQISFSESNQSTAQVESVKDHVIAKHQEEIAELKLELRKKDRIMRKEIRRHSKQLRHVSESEVAIEWQTDQDYMVDAESVKAIDRSIDIIFRTHKAALARADKLARTLSELNAIELEEEEKRHQEWQRERTLRREEMKSLDIIPGAQELHVDVSPG